MNAHRGANSRRLIQMNLADPVAVPPNRDPAKDHVDALRQHDVDTADYLEWVCAFATDALIELIQARLEEEEDAEGWNDAGVMEAAVTSNRRSRLLH